VLTLAVVGCALWFVAVPRYRPGLRAGERYGVDVSGHQGDIDWHRARQDGIGFAYIKATEGGDFVDGRLTENWQGSAAAGVDHGAYHFFSLCRSGADQAENFLRAVPTDPQALPPAVDLEFVGNCSARPPRDDLLRELKVFIDRVEVATGRTVAVYVLDDFDARYGVSGSIDQPVWIRHFILRPGTDDWLIWQVNGHSSVDGISGDVDLDVMKSP